MLLGGKVNIHFNLDHQMSFGDHHAILGSSKDFEEWKKNLMMSWSDLDLKITS
jgi:hypothetical protein